MTQNPELVCPLCGGHNHCALAEGRTEACWCVGVTIAPETLAALPEESVGTRCICPRCAAGTTEKVTGVEG